MMRKLWYKWVANRDLNWNKYVINKYAYETIGDLGSDLHNKKVSDVVSGMIKINGHEDFK